MVAGDDWARLRGGLAQRVAALEAFLHDVHGERQVVRDRIVPAWVVDGAPGLRGTGGHLPPDTVRITLAGIDLVRDGTGEWLVLEDNLNMPAGLAYALAARRLAATVLPELDPGTAVLKPDQVPALLHAALTAAAPPRAPRATPSSRCSAKDRTARRGSSTASSPTRSACPWSPPAT
ncbi:circularly permuted type 2 ATP-grasp protein [Yinghuangia aomiensis]